MKLVKILDKQQEIMEKISKVALMSQVMAIVGMYVGNFLEVDVQSIQLLILSLTGIQVLQMVICTVVCQITSAYILSGKGDK